MDVKEIAQRSNGTLQIRYHPGTLPHQRSGNRGRREIGKHRHGHARRGGFLFDPRDGGLAWFRALVQNYNQAYTMFNGEIGKQMADLIERKYKLRVLIYMDMGSRHFWNTKRPINTPEDLKGLKLRVQQGKVFADTVNGLGASAVPMGWTEVIPAVQRGWLTAPIFRLPTSST